MVADKPTEGSTPNFGELDADKVIQAIAKLAATHAAYINLYPELEAIKTAIIGEITVVEPEADHPLLLRLLNIIQVLNTQAKEHKVFEVIRDNFKADLFHGIDSGLPAFEGEFYL